MTREWAGDQWSGQATRERPDDQANGRAARGWVATRRVGRPGERGNQGSGRARASGNQASGNQASGNQAGE
ncbi:hypothetical protein GCM10020358_41720 [Amorphoplanes nipponensis]|uniref:Uncharacterized protein n=1 Tax=Actinoplanes nipponensis TaxID=135950 RepID=A0A919JC27_9ACTN|nr:hypothetical protein Ani05nite_11700 [Actinoplanes nipponensis]